LIERYFRHKRKRKHPTPSHPEPDLRHKVAPL